MTPLLDGLLRSRNWSLSIANQGSGFGVPSFAAHLNGPGESRAGFGATVWFALLALENDLMVRGVPNAE